MNFPGNFGWTEERVELLKKLWADKSLSAPMIAAEMGATSRNSVIGKAHRLGLPARGPTPKPKTSSRGILAAIKKKNNGPAKTGQPALFAGGFAALRQGSKTPPSPPPPPEPKPGKGVSLFDLYDEKVRPLNKCHWPINYPPRGGEYLFCGAPTWNGCSWCEAHERRALTEEGWKRTMAAKRGRAAA